MKKILLSFLFIFTISFNSSYSQTTGDQNNALLEYCTGTWCQWCPCGHTIIDGILSNYPNTVVLAYHGASTDPWQTYSAGIRGLFGFSSYPSGVVGRKTGIISRDGWNNPVVIQSFANPGVTISISNRVWNAGTRTFTCDVNMTARAMLDGNYSVNYVLTENNIIYTQTGNGSCAGASAYHHEHVVKAMINGDLGTPVVTSGHWMTGEMVTKSLSYTVPEGIVPDNCNINIFVYKVGTSISTDYLVQQALSFPMTVTTGIGNNGTVVSDYSLAQNYPNPFNPVTNIRYSIPTDGNVSFKVYDMLGNQVAEYVNGFQKSGIYTVTFDGASLASGVYYYKLEAGNFVETKKMMLVK
ncbi:MAG: Omp28-related outer membrane protein [Ignavibacteria bacterium]|nr:Omp28-related outer membrane protein [Ignavibacteria bacterium]